MNAAAHGVVAHTTEFLTEQVVTALYLGLRPDIRDLPRNEIHLDAELRHGKVMQDVVRRNKKVTA